MDKKLKDLMDDGWELEPEELDRVERAEHRKNITRSIDNIAQSVKQVADATNKNDLKNQQAIMKIIDLQSTQAKIMERITGPRTVIAEVIARNKKDYTSKIKLTIN